MYSVAIAGKDRQDAINLERAVKWRNVGCHVSCICRDGDDAWSKLRQIQPDILVTEVSLPDMNGLELIRKKNEMLLPTQVVIVTEQADFHCAKRAVELEVTGYLLKPIVHEEMHSALFRAIRRLENRRQQGGFFFMGEGTLEYKLAEINALALNYPMPVRQALLYIERNLYEQISLTGLCDYLGLTPPHVSRIFKQEVGVGYAVYVSMRKMSEARKLLNVPGNKPGQVAELLGYHNYSYFYQVFKKQFGTGPAGRLL